MKYPLINDKRKKFKIPKRIELSVALIREELKIMKLFNHLSEIGFGFSDFEPFLGKMILFSMNLDDGTDKTFDIFMKVIERRSRNLNGDYDQITSQALKAYYEIQRLVKERRSKIKER